MTCLGVLERGKRGKDNETSLKEGGSIEMSTTVLPYTRCSLSSLKNTHLSITILSIAFAISCFFLTFSRSMSK